MSNLIAYLKGHWRAVAIIAGAALIVISAGSFMILAGMRSKSMARPSATSANININWPSAAATAKTYAGLYAVSIDNMVDARPAAGINQAAFIYEAPVEGGITRFLAFFERGVQVPKIGPVRSARLYFLDWAAAWGAGAFFHLGGSPEAMARIATTPTLHSIDEDGVLGAGNVFFRDAQRLAPHNAYTSSAGTESVLSGSGSTTAWLMADDPDISSRGADGGKVMPALSNDLSYDPVWVYSSATNVYTRTVKGQVEKDAAGAAVAAKNIIVMSVDASVIDAEGRLKIGTAGSGSAVVYSNGFSQDATWNEDPSAVAPPRFTAADGSPITLANGNVWIEVVKK